MPRHDYGSLMNQLLRLFGMWKDAHCNEDEWIRTTLHGIEQDSFVEDGIVSSAYDGKVLFVLKEANILEYKGNGEPSQRSQIDWYSGYAQNDPNVKDNIPSKQLEKLGRMYCYLVNHNDSPTESDVRNAVGRSAFMNLNKRGGASKTRPPFLRYVRKYYSLGFIPKQIDILNPQYIVCLGINIADFLLSIDPQLSSKYNIIGMYHTGIWGSVGQYMEKFKGKISLLNMA